jgi:hypothetical protein
MHVTQIHIPHHNSMASHAHVFVCKIFLLQRNQYKSQIIDVNSFSHLKLGYCFILFTLHCIITDCIYQCVLWTRSLTPSAARAQSQQQAQQCQCQCQAEVEE